MSNQIQNSTNQLKGIKVGRSTKERILSKLNGEKIEDTNNVSDVKLEVVNPKFDIYVSELTPYIDENNLLYEDIYSKTVRMTYNYIQIGNILTKCKNELSKDDCLKIQKHFDLEERTVYRYIKLVSDDKVSKLTIDDLTSMLKPSMGKLVKMSKLNDDDFNLVLSGDDTPLIGNNTNGDVKKENIFKDSIDDKTYFELLKMTKVDIMRYFITVIEELNSENEYLFDIVETNNLYYKSEEEKTA